MIPWLFFVISYFVFLNIWTAIPMLICALLGARVGMRRFQWKQIVWSMIGLLAGLVVGTLAALVASTLVGWYLSVPVWEVFFAGIATDCVVGFLLAYSIGRVGRPDPTPPTPNLLEDELEQIDKLLRARLKAAGVESEPELDITAVEQAGILSGEQARQLATIRKAWEDLLKANVVVYDDVKLWTNKAKELRRQLGSQG